MINSPLTFFRDLLNQLVKLFIPEQNKSIKKTVKGGLNKNINKFCWIFHNHSTKTTNVDQNINTFQTDPNAMKYEINQYKYLGSSSKKIKNESMDFVQTFC
jgi:hypothetical protein